MSASPNSVPSAAAPVAAAAPLTQAEANWEFPNGNTFNQDYNPQNQINSSDAQSLGVSWIYPLPSLPGSLSAVSNPCCNQPGVGMSILIVNGTAFATSQWDQTIAFDIANGNVIWTFSSPLNPSTALNESTLFPLHNHDGNEWFTTATFGSGVKGPTLWFQGDNNVVYAVNSLTGKLELNFTDFTGLSMVPGNNPVSIYSGVTSSNIIINQQLGILVSGHDAEFYANNGRGFFAGWNLNANPPTIKWITPVVPPQPDSNVPLNPYFAQQEIANMTGAYTFYPGENGSTNGYTTPWEVAGGVLHNVNDNIVVNWKALSSAQLNASLYNDWGQSFQSAQCLAITGGASTGSTGAGWGGEWVVGSGQTAGMVFVATNNKDPYDGQCEPGPNLWSASTLALNMSTGKLIWAFQANAHDLWDWDCSWYQGMANETIAGVNTEVIFKTCKNGYLYEINALTGDLVWAWSPPSNVVTPGPARCAVCYMWNPLNASQMHFDFPTAMTNCAPAFTVACVEGNQPPALFWPAAPAGFEGEQAYDPATNMVYATSHILPYLMGYVPLTSSSYVNGYGLSFPGGFGTPPNSNATTWGLNAATGQIVWHHNILNEGYRGRTSVSGGLVFVTLSSGDILMLNAQNGDVVRDYYIGAPMDVGVSVGASVTGQEYILTPVGTCALGAVVTCPGSTPGDIIALTLQGQPGVAPSTTTVTEQGPVVTTTTTATVSGSGSTAIPISMTTVTSPGTSTGVSTTTLYAVAAVAVIFIIATGYLAMRGRKPAS